MAALASYTDANDILDNTKIAFADQADADKEARHADAIIQGKLAELYPDHVSLWSHDASDGETTPELPRRIAAMLMASFRYAKKYSEETDKESPYAKRLEERAMALLEGLCDGTYSLGDVAYDDARSRLEQSDFWPNDTTGEADGESGQKRKFTTEMVF